MIGGAVTLLYSGLMVKVILRVSSRKSETLSIFAYIPPAEITRLIEASQSVSIRKARYNPSLSDFRENEKRESDKDTDKKEHKAETVTRPAQTIIQRPTTQALLAPSEEVKGDPDASANIIESVRMEKKRAHLNESYGFSSGYDNG